MGEEYLREAKARRIELDAEAYSIVNLLYTCVIWACVRHGNMVQALRGIALHARQFGVWTVLWIC